MDVQDGWTMLDVGCGGGFTIRRLLKRSKDAQVYGIDISEESVAKAKKVNAEVLDKQVFITQGSAEKLPYEDKKFDLVTAVETVYFWPNLPDCLQEVRRVLKPGGKFAILVEVVDSDSKWTSVVEGMTAYSPEDLKKLLDDAGYLPQETNVCYDFRSKTIICNRVATALPYLCTIKQYLCIRWVLRLCDIAIFISLGLFALDQFDIQTFHQRQFIKDFIV